MSRTRTRPNLSKQIQGYVTQAMIDAAKGCDPNKCMYKLGIAFVLNIPHGYIKVDATGVSVTRRTDYREKAFLPQAMANNMVLFDLWKEQMEAFKKGLRKDEPKCLVKPHKFKLTFHKTTKVYRSSDDRKEQINTARRRRREEGRPDKSYSLHKRIIGLAVSPDLLEKVA